MPCRADTPKLSKITTYCRQAMRILGKTYLQSYLFPGFWPYITHNRTIRLFSGQGLGIHSQVEVGLSHHSRIYDYRQKTCQSYCECHSSKKTGLASEKRRRKKQIKFPYCFWEESRPYISYHSTACKVDAILCSELTLCHTQFAIILCLTTSVCSFHLVKTLIIYSESIFFSMQCTFLWKFICRLLTLSPDLNKVEARPSISSQLPLKKALLFFYRCYL